MDDVSFTPGPWRVDGVDVRDDEDRLVADCDCFTYTDEGEVRLPDCEANARLIAAAPLLYEAGAKVLAGLNERIDKADPACVPIFAGIADLHAALARARGEPA